MPFQLFTVCFIEVCKISYFQVRRTDKTVRLRVLRYDCFQKNNLVMNVSLVITLKCRYFKIAWNNFLLLMNDRLNSRQTKLDKYSVCLEYVKNHVCSVVSIYLEERVEFYRNSATNFEFIFFVCFEFLIRS